MKAGIALAALAALAGGAPAADGGGGNKAAVAMTLFIFPIAFLMGGLVHRLGALIGL